MYINSHLKMLNDSLNNIYDWANEKMFMSSYVWNVSKILMKSVSSAPEVLSGGPYNHTADWWSLGILLFALATGKVRKNAHIIEKTSCVFLLIVGEMIRLRVSDVSFLPSHSKLPLPLHACLSFPYLQNRITVACWGRYAASLMRCHEISLLHLLCCLQRWDLDTWWVLYWAKCSK